MVSSEPRGLALRSCLRLGEPERGTLGATSVKGSEVSKMIFSFMVTVCVVAALLPFSRALVTCFGGRGLTNEWESITRMSVPAGARQ